MTAVLEQGSATSTLVGGRYRLGETLGAGAAGVVWRAHDERLDRPAAVKQLEIPPGLAAADAERRHRDAAREGRIAARLDHRGVVAMLDMVVEAGSSWLVMELVDGPSLAALIERGPLAPAEAARIGAAVADALAAAHGVGVVHSDVKPKNVLIDADGTVKLADFGIARAVRGDGMTGPDEVSGTPLYMAPEVARGRRPDTASDVFSLASTVYAMVEGRPPFGTMDRGPLAMIDRVARGAPYPTRRAGPLTGVLAALFLDAAHRPTAAAARDMLASVARSASRAVVPLSVRSPRPRAGMVPLAVVRAAAAAEPTAVRPTAVRPTAVRPTAVRPTAVRPTAVRPVPVEPTTVVPTTVVPAAVVPFAPRRSRRALVPLSAAGVVALGAVAGVVGGGPAQPLVQTASDLLNRVVGADAPPAPVAAPTAPESPAVAPPAERHVPPPVPVAAAPIVPAPERSAALRDVLDDGDTAAGTTGPTATGAASGATASSPVSTSPAAEVDLPAVQDRAAADRTVEDAVDDVPVVGPAARDLTSGIGDGGPVSEVTDGLSDGVSGVTDGLSDASGTVTDGLTDGVSGVTGTVSSVTRDVLGGSAADRSDRSDRSGRSERPASLTSAVTSAGSGLLGNVASGRHRAGDTAGDTAGSSAAGDTGGSSTAGADRGTTGGVQERSGSAAPRVSVLSFATERVAG